MFNSDFTVSKPNEAAFPCLLKLSSIALEEWEKLKARYVCVTVSSAIQIKHNNIFTFLQSLN